MALNKTDRLSQSIEGVLVFGLWFVDCMFVIWCVPGQSQLPFIGKLLLGGVTATTVLYLLKRGDRRTPLNGRK